MSIIIIKTVLWYSDIQCISFLELLCTHHFPWPFLYYFHLMAGVYKKAVCTLVPYPTSLSPDFLCDLLSMWTLPYDHVLLGVTKPALLPHCLTSVTGNTLTVWRVLTARLLFHCPTVLFPHFLIVLCHTVSWHHGHCTISSQCSNTVTNEALSCKTLGALSSSTAVVWWCCANQVALDI